MTRGRLSWWQRVAVTLGTLLLRVLGATWRVRTIGLSHKTSRRAAGVPSIFAFWHGQMLPLLYRHRGEGVALLISSHADGEMIARVARAFGERTVRGSSSQGMTSALRAIVRTLRDGIDVGVTPDGPRGPAGHFAPGAVIAAFQARTPIVLMAASADRAWQLGSWDRFMIPKPFARVTIAYGEPWFAPGTSAREAAECAPAVGALLDALVELARAG
jgi:lysophospholipid acyltransferase (LPLAT)-like uncharacterized protein